MIVYKALGDGTIASTEVSVLPQKSEIKIKITHVLPTKTDEDIFLGKAKINYPFVPCHVAIGVVSEDRPEFGLKRGTKVILNPYRIPHLDRLDMAAELNTYGYDTDGFFAEFVYLPLENVIPFPDAVKEDEAIFCEFIAIALSAINSFNVEKGDYIAVIGGGALGNIIAQFAIYFQAIPIVIDSDPNRLKAAEESGVYYTVNTGIEVATTRVLEITGGRLCEHVIMESSDINNPNLFFDIARKGGDCTIVNVNGRLGAINADINRISDKSLKVRGVSNGAREFNSAVYTLAQKSLVLSPLVEKKVSLNDKKPEESFQKALDSTLSAVVVL